MLTAMRVGLKEQCLKEIIAKVDRNGKYGSIKKRARQNEKRAAVNKSRRSRIRTFLRKVEEAISNGDKAPLALPYCSAT